MSFQLRHIGQIAATVTAGKKFAERTTLFFNDCDGSGKIALIHGAKRRKNSGSASADDEHIDFLDCKMILVQAKNLFFVRAVFIEWRQWRLLP